MRRPSESKAAEELKKIVEALKPCRPKKVSLFGSFARGDYHSLSDLDLIIIKDTKKRFLDRIVEVLELLDTSIPVEPLVYTSEEIDKLLAEDNSLITQALTEGRVLYDEAEERS